MKNESVSATAELFDARLLTLLPHRPPMLLINRIIELSAHSASALVTISESTAFFRPGLGVPSWIGLEYMGQTAALIGGYQLQQGALTAHLGFLLGTRSYQVDTAYFPVHCQLLIQCQQKAVVGEGLAQFDCTILNRSNDHAIARATLSVYRKALPA